MYSVELQAFSKLENVLVLSGRIAVPHRCCLLLQAYRYIYVVLHCGLVISMIMFMVLSSWQNHCESSSGSFDECKLSARWSPYLRPSQPTWNMNALVKAATIRIRHRRLLLLLSTKADTNFTVPIKADG